VDDVIVEADKSSLQKMVVILLDNAIKYTPEKGKVMLSTNQDKRQVLLSVEDTGIGIAKEDLPHVFDRFYRMDQSRSKTNVPGFGLGLSIVKRIVDLHKGSIGVSSAPEKGSTFTVRLPLKHS